MKTRINRLAVIAIFTLLLLGGNSYAKGTKLIASGHETIKEPAMKVENWMISDGFWNTGESVYSLEEADDKDLNLESWMINESVWGNVDLSNIETEVEDSLALEPWMVNAYIWERESLSYIKNEVESDLVLEPWMTNENTWNIQ